MKILAPVSTYNSAVDLISAGAEEIYLGGDENVFNTFSFTGRGKVAPGNIRVLNNINQVREIVQYAHDKGVRVNFLGNTPFFNNGIFNGKALEEYFWEYIEKGIDAGVDSIIIGDIGLLKLISKRNYPVKIHASLFFKTINKQQVLFLKELGVGRVILSYHITLEEISDLCSYNNMEFEVVGYLGCSFFNGACSFMHDMGEGVLNDFFPGATCKGVYKITIENRNESVRLFEAETCCSICQLYKLELLGVEALKVVGRERDPKNNCNVIALYKKFLDYYRAGFAYEDKQHEIPEWWKNFYCSKRKCKYKTDTPDYTYVIGG